MASKYTMRELYRLMEGVELGRGVSRVVYANRLDPSTVIKVETRGQSYANIIEWETWQLHQYGPLARWLAPCVAISPSGGVLIQRRTDPIRRSELPSKIPAQFTDIKPENWGMLDGRPVCHDYGIFPLGANMRLRKADWHE